MAKIGAFSKTEHGYKGRVRTLTLNTEMELVLTRSSWRKMTYSPVVSGCFAQPGVIMYPCNASP
jgi:uncharacterized protein (DUF736 family)